MQAVQGISTSKLTVFDVVRIREAQTASRDADHRHRNYLRNRDGNVFARTLGPRYSDRVDISEAARFLAQVYGEAAPDESSGTEAHSSKEQTADAGHGTAGKRLSKEEQEQVRELAQRDKEVRQHEQAHLMAGGHLARGGARYDYQRGPDGRQYAVGGEVNISLGGGNTPEERLHNSSQAERAALAPGEPSPQDRKVAAEARRQALDAQREIAEERAEQTEQPSGTDGSHGAVDGGRGESVEDLVPQPGLMKRAAEAYRLESDIPMLETMRGFSIAAGALGGSMHLSA